MQYNNEMPLEQYQYRVTHFRVDIQLPIRDYNTIHYLRVVKFDSTLELPSPSCKHLISSVENLQSLMLNTST